MPETIRPKEKSPEISPEQKQRYTQLRQDVARLLKDVYIVDQNARGYRRPQFTKDWKMRLSENIAFDAWKVRSPTANLWRKLQSFPQKQSAEERGNLLDEAEAEFKQLDSMFPPDLRALARTLLVAQEERRALSADEIAGMTR